MKALGWLVGEWDVEARVTGKSERAPERGHSTVTTIHGGVWIEIRDTYPSGVQDVGYLGYSAVTGRWTSVSLDSVGNANITSAPAWQNERLAFEGDVVVLGVAAHLRQTLHRINADEYELINEERIGGAWRKLDAYHYRRTR
jgi:hypothetical protein